MRPAIGKLDGGADPVGLDQAVIPGVAVDLQDAGEALQNIIGILPAAPGRIGEGYAGRGSATPGSVIAGERPEVSGFGLARLWVENRRAGVLRGLRGPTGATVPYELHEQFL